MALPTDIVCLDFGLHILIKKDKNPTLLGVNEILTKLFKKNRCDHSVLNEIEIVGE